MASLLVVYRMQNEAELKNRVASAAAKQAYYVLTTEAPETANHTARVAWAKTVLLNPEAEANRMLWSVLQNGDIQAGPVSGEAAYDTLIEYVVNVLTDVFASMGN